MHSTPLLSLAGRSRRLGRGQAREARASPARGRRGRAWATISPRGAIRRRVSPAPPQVQHAPRTRSQARQGKVAPAPTSMDLCHRGGGGPWPSGLGRAGACARRRWPLPGLGGFLAGLADPRALLDLDRGAGARRRLAARARGRGRRRPHAAGRRHRRSAPGVRRGRRPARADRRSLRAPARHPVPGGRRRGAARGAGRCPGGGERLHRRVRPLGCGHARPRGPGRSHGRARRGRAACARGDPGARRALRRRRAPRAQDRLLP